MRLTINLDEDLYAMARSHAVAEKTSISKAVCDLLRRKGAIPNALLPLTRHESSYFDPVLGIQVSRGDRPFTSQDVQDLIDDDDLRHLEIAGWTRDQSPKP